MVLVMTGDDDAREWAAGTGSDINDDDCSILRWVSMLLESDEISRTQRGYALAAWAVCYGSAIYLTSRSNKRKSRKV